MSSCFTATKTGTSTLSFSPPCRLAARRAIAVSPQSPIDPAAVRLERRYGEQWAGMHGWLHDSRAHMDGARSQIVMYDPMYGQDKKHEARLPKPAGYTGVLLRGAGHAGIYTIVGIGKHDTLFDLLRGDILARAMRQAYRAGRSDGFRYLRKLGSILHEKNKPAARKFLENAEQKGFDHLIKKWTPFYK